MKIPDPFADDPWSWAFVIFRPIPDFPGYGVDTNGNLWSCWLSRSSGYRIGDRWFMRKLYPNNRSGYLVSRDTISKAASGQTWKHVPMINERARFEAGASEGGGR